MAVGSFTAIAGKCIIGGPLNARLFPGFAVVTTTPVDGVETAMATIGPVSTFLDSDRIAIDALAQWLVGAGDEDLSWTLRRGADLTGPIVNSGNVDVLAAADGSVLQVVVEGIDAPGSVDNQLYTIGVTVAAP